MNDDLRAAALAVLTAADAYRDALNGNGHRGEPHDQDLHHGLPGDVQVYETVGDCGACGGAQYGAETDLYAAYGDLREAMGQKRLSWE